MNSLIPSDNRVPVVHRPEFTDDQNVLLSDISACIAHAVYNHMKPTDVICVFLLVLRSMSKAIERTAHLVEGNPNDN